MNTHFFVIPFAASGDTASIPETVQSDHSISFPEGYSYVYALNPEVDPSAILINRQTFNGLMFDITSSLAALQTDFAQWVNSTDNLGTPFGYNNGAVVRYTDGQLWQSIITSNTATPGTDITKWIVFGSQWALTAALNAEIARAEAAEALLAPLLSPILTGTPQAPTPAPGTGGNLIATCSFVASAVAAETARAEAAEALLAPLNSPVLTGNPTCPTPVAGGSIANASYVTASVAAETNRAIAAEALLAPLNSAALTGVPTAPTAPPGTNTGQLASTAFVQQAVAASGLQIRYARVPVSINGPFANAGFTWNSVFPTACLCAVASCEANDVFSPNANGNNFVAVAFGPGGMNTLPNQFGGTVRIDTDEGARPIGTVYVDVIGIGN